MAEARAIASLETKPIQLSYDPDNGIQFDIHIRIPRLAEVIRGVKMNVKHFVNGVRNSIFPMPPLLVLGLVVLGVVLIVNAEPDSWLRTGWLAEAVWGISLWFPWFSNFPLLPKLCILAAYTALFFALVIATLQRVLIRLLLNYKGFLYNSRRPTLGMKLWGVAMRLLVGNRHYTLYNFQSVLPSLPVPPLKDTCARYLKSAKNLQDGKKFLETARLAEEFLRNEGPKLQRYLILKSWYAKNYVTDWWEKYVYLIGRSPIVINSNYYILDSAYGIPTSIQEARLAVLLWNFMKYRIDLENENMEPTMLPGGIVPLCMEQFRRLFSTTRLPGRECDTIKHWPATQQSTHVAVLCNGSFYRLDLLTREGRQVPMIELETQLAAIKLDALSRTPEGAEGSIAALTGENRTRWAEVRETHFSEGLNRASLNTIESALFFVHMDLETVEVDTWTGRAHALMHGNGATRWFDKSITLVVFKNGRAGLNAEHSFADAPVVAHLFEKAMIVAEKMHAPYGPDGHVLPLASPSSSDGCRRDSFIPWRRLSWALTRHCEEAITTAVRNVNTLIDDLDLEVVCFDRYGKGFMKTCNVSPDAFIQMAMQLAYFRHIGTFHATYEASMTRLFRNGRTETVRPVTDESCEFVKAMLEPKVSGEAKLKLLQKAAETHQLGYTNAMAGRGLDRHMFALYIVSKGMNIESKFLQGVLSEPWRLSTSQQPQNQTGLWDPRKPDDAKRVSPGGGFGPVADDGYGVSYMVASEDATYFHVSSKKSCARTSSKEFVRHLFQALDDMKEVLSLATQAKSIKKD